MGTQIWRFMVLTTGLVLSACSAAPTVPVEQAESQLTATPEFLAEHSSRNALDWQGRYHGLLPCADCAGIYVVIDLDATAYQYRAQYLGTAGEKASRTAFFSQGLFAWNQAGSHIELKNMDAGPAFYQVVEGALVQRDMQGQMIETDHPHRYRLPKLLSASAASQQLQAMGDWQLTDIDGIPEANTSSPGDTSVYIAFNENQVAYGFSGCNRFRGSYELTSASALTFGPLASTKMACPQPPGERNIETEFHALLQSANRFILAGDQLLIFSEPSGRSARFVATPETDND